jgi:uncharacterized integral membrane protein
VTVPQPPVGAPGPEPSTGPGPFGPGSLGPGSGGPVGTEPAAAGPARRTGRTVGRTLALALLLFVTVVLVLFVVFNTQTVDISLVFGDVDAPLVLALVIAAALGGLLVWLAGLTLRARRNRRSS